MMGLGIRGGVLVATKLVSRQHPKGESVREGEGRQLLIAEAPKD
jgi:hypothetical protein